MSDDLHEKIEASAARAEAGVRDAAIVFCRSLDGSPAFVWQSALGAFCEMILHILGDRAPPGWFDQAKTTLAAGLMLLEQHKTGPQDIAPTEH